METLTLNNAENALQQSFEQAVLLAFWAHFSPESQQFLNVLQEEESHFENVVFYSANIEEAPQLAQYFGLEGLPALKLIQQGQLTNQATGALNAEQLRSFLKDFLKNERDFHAEITAALQEKNTHLALQLAQQALMENPQDETILLDLAEIYLNQKEKEQAKSLLSQKFVAQIARQQALSKRLEMLENAQDIAPIQSALEQNPNDLSLQLAYSQALAQNGNFEQAIDVALQVLSQNKHFEEGKAQKMLIEFFNALSGEQFDDFLRQKRRQMSRLLN